MKLRILNYHISATHDLISNLSFIREPMSISDFHAFVYDPSGLSDPPLSSTDVTRRQAEIRDLIHGKGGIVVCILRPQAAGDWLLNLAVPALSGLIRAGVRDGTGSQFKILPSARGVSGGYFQVLKGALQFTAHLDLSESLISQSHGTVFAVDSVGHPIAVEFLVGEERICFLPLPNNIPADRLGAAIVKAISAHFNRTTQIDAPLWAVDIGVPGANIHDEQIAELTKQTEELAGQIISLKEEREKVQGHVRLLFSYGKAVLEPGVRSAFRLLGFDVPEPEEYVGEWDVELQVQSGRTALGEVEGSGGRN